MTVHWKQTKSYHMDVNFNIWNNFIRENGYFEEQKLHYLMRWIFLMGSDENSCTWYDHLCATVIIIKYRMHKCITYFKTSWPCIENRLKVTIWMSISHLKQFHIRKYLLWRVKIALPDAVNIFSAKWQKKLYLIWSLMCNWDHNQIKYA